MQTLTPELLDQGLSSIQKTADGSTYAFSEVCIEDKNLNTIGEALADYDHLRVIKFNKNKLDNIDKLRSLKYLQILEARENCIEDNYFMSESKQQLRFLTNVDLSGNKLTKLRQLLCNNLRSLKVDNNNIESCELVSHQTLTEISAVKNKLTNLEGFHNLGELTDLNLASNEITSLQGIRGCNKLRNLNLQGNKIVTFEDVPYLPGLQVLNLHSNPIADLAEIGKLITFENLSELNLLESPLAEEKGDDLKKEVLILLDGLSIKKINDEEVTADDITDAKAEKAQRIKDAEEARLAAEEEARLKKQEEDEAAAAAAAAAAEAAE